VTDWFQRVEQHIQDRRLLKPGQAVLVAVSGGLDSMALLHTLHQLAPRNRWRLTVAHFNHQLRGCSSLADEKLVRKTAAAMKCPVRVEKADVRSFARTSKLSIEMAARKLRHEFFARVARKQKIRTIALAHHAGDQVELFFLRLLRGAGGAGLAGMKCQSPSPVDPEITLVRPFLDVTRAELRGFARENKIRFREDATNASLAMPRNRVRHELLPLLRRHYQPALAKTVLRLMEIVGADAEVVGEMAAQWRKGRQPVFDDLPVAVQRRVLQLELEGLAVPADFDLVEQLRKSANRSVSISSTLSVQRDAAGAVKLQTSLPATDFNHDCSVLKLAGRAGSAEFDGLRLSWRLEAITKFARPRRQVASEFFDADRVGGEITLRHWRSGDRFQPIGMKAAVKLQDLFTNLKIPRVRRRELLVAMAESGEIFWVEGLRIGERFKLTGPTRHRLIWHWRRFGGFSKPSLGTGSAMV